MTQTLVTSLLHRLVTPLSIQALPVAFEWWKPSHSMPDCWVCWASRALRDGHSFFLCLLLKSLLGPTSSFIYLCTNPPRPEMPFHSPVLKRAEAGAKHQTEDCLTWVTGGLFTVPLQIPMPANVFPVVSCARDSRQFPPCLIIPGISSFSGTLEVKWQLHGTSYTEMSKAHIHLEERNWPLTETQSPLFDRKWTISC